MVYYNELIDTATVAALTWTAPRFAETIDFRSLVAILLTVTFIIHGIAFTIIALRRRKPHYFFLTSTFTFLAAIFFIRFESWTLKLPFIGLPVTMLLRMGAALCTTGYLWFTYNEEGSWVWKLTHWSKPNG